MTTLADLQDEFAFLTDRLDRIEALVAFGKELEPMPDQLKTDATLVRGCEAKVWTYPTPRDDGTLHFYADSNAGTTKGIVALVVAAVQDRAPADILAVDFAAVLQPFDIGRFVTSKRTSGIPNMIELIRETAARYATA